MELTDEERNCVGKESARNGEWTKITIKNVHTLLEMEDNDDRKSFLDYLCIDLNYVEEQRNNLSSKHRNLVQELNACKEQLLVFKQEKLDLLTMQHVNTGILKENQNLRLKLKELTSITETWLNSFNKVNHNVHKSSEAEDSTLFDDSSVCSTPLLPLKKLDGVELGFGPKTVKSILKSKSTFKTKTLKGITLNEPSLAPAIGNKSSSASKTNSTPAGKLKNVKVEDDPPLAMVMKELNELKLQISKKKYNNHLSDDCLYYPTCEICGSYDHNNHDHNKIISQRRGINPVTKNCQTSGSNVHTISDHNDIVWLRKRETPHAKKAESSNALRSKTPTKRNPTLLLLRELSELSTNMDIKSTSGGIYREVGLNTFRNAIGAHYLPHSSEYVAPPSIDVVRKWFPTIGYGEEVSTKGTLKKSLLPPRWRLLMAQIIQCLGGKTGGFDQITNKDVIMLYSLANCIHIDYANIFWEDIILKLKKKQREKALKPKQPEEPPFTAHMLAICALDKPVVFKAPKTSSRAESVSQGAKPRAKTGYKKTATSSK
ncbi:hypothetical protein Tco_0162509 [Tanacetum coccineum]